VWIGIRPQLGNVNEKEWEWTIHGNDLYCQWKNSQEYFYCCRFSLGQSITPDITFWFMTVEIFLSDYQSIVNDVFRILVFNDWCPVFHGTVFLLLDCRLFAFKLTLHCFAARACVFGNGIGMGITQWESHGNWNTTYTHLGMGVGRNVNWLHGNGRECEYKIHSRSSLLTTTYY